MTWKERAFLISLPVALVVFFFLATPGPNDTIAPAQRYTPLGWETVDDNLAEVVSFRWLQAGASLTDPHPIKVLEEAFNVDIESIFLTPEAMSTAQPLMLSSGNIPDLMNPGGNSRLRKYAYHGYLTEIPYEMLAAHAPNIVRLANRYIPNIWPALALDGRNYGIPHIWYGGLQPRLGVWRLDWLRKVGIPDIPSTLPEYEEAFRRFRHNDPDGNGRQDTYGLTGDLTSPYVTFTEIFGAFGVMPYNWMLKDEQVVWGGTQPGARQALELLRKWYREDLIHPDFLTDRWYREVDSKFKNGQVGYVNYMASYEAFNPHNPSSLINVMSQLQPGIELAPGVPPVGPGGERGHRVWGAAGAILAFGKSAVEDPQMMIRILHMLDSKVAQEELFVRTVLGERGVHWEWADSPDHSAGVKFLAPYDTSQARGRLGLAGDVIFIDGTWPEIFQKYLSREMVEWNQLHRKVEWARPDLFYWSTSVPKAEEYLPDLERLQQTVYADIIRGLKPIEAFDQFVKDWHAQGGDIILAEARDTYQTAVKLRRKLEQLTSAPSSAEGNNR